MAARPHARRRGGIATPTPAAGSPVAEDIATVVGTPDGVAVFTHLWWTATIPIEDPVAEDAAALHNSRARVLAFADLVIPGHGPAFRPDASTPR